MTFLVTLPFSIRDSHEVVQVIPYMGIMKSLKVNCNLPAGRHYCVQISLPGSREMNYFDIVKVANFEKNNLKVPLNGTHELGIYPGSCVQLEGTVELSIDSLG